ncbi:MULTISPECIES: PQQ-binding-like beta-propeller repeat protein [Streptacidiphilus]|uniref:PQQ-binding-like beta-propeller repeat protein n=1 Tax=Streptacidiphilus cavernicola TaxID=3342716 RepID=A0ABV6UWW2_9ACTN|nr:serine/threonine-protein kinase [Streptacidiphilus jeojiense]
MDQLTAHDPRRIGPFEVLGRLGAGGMGLVYLARSSAGRRVAIKTVRAELAEDQLFRVRFAREIAAARTVSGFYTAPVVEADADAPVPWLATAYIPAPSLEDLVAECGPMPVGAVRWLVAGIAEALQSIHAAGLVHRDLKPSNVLVTEDGPRVIDFGIAAGVSHTRLTMTNVAVGTPAYMSPEQARDSRSVTGASDVFSLGSMLVYAATGHAPYHGANPVETVFMLLRESPDLSGLAPDLAPLVKACMRPAPERRLTPAQIQSELAPHLYSNGDGDDDSRDWLPPAALELIDRKRGRRNTPPPPVPVPVPAPVPAPVPLAAPVAAPVAAPSAGYDPRTAHPAPVAQPSALDEHAPTKKVQPAAGGGRRHAGAPDPEPAPAAQAQAAAQAPVAAPVPSTTPTPVVQLLGGSVAIGPGVRAGETGGPGPDDSLPPAATGWVRRVPGQGPGGQGPGSNRENATHQNHGRQAAATSEPAAAVPAPPTSGSRWRPWRFRMSNDVWGVPQVSDGVLYVTSFEVHALDIATGRRRFKTRDVAWAMSVADGQVHAADGPSLFTLAAADGEERWRVTLDGWTYSLDAGGGALVAGTRGGGVQVRSAIDGSQMWQVGDAQQEYESPQSGPCVVGDSVYYYGGGMLRALDLTTGRPRWAVQVGEDVPSRPVLRQGVLYLTSGARVLALDEESGEERWRFKAPVVLFTPPTLDDQGSLFAADYLGAVFALDTGTGALRWQARTGGRQGIDPVVHEDGTVLVGSGDTVYAFAARDGEERWRHTARGELTGAPAAFGGLVHFGSRDHSLYTLDLTTGRLRWKLDTGGEITGSPVAVDGRVFACSKDRCVYALDAARGTATRD